MSLRQFIKYFLLLVLLAVLGGVFYYYRQAQLVPEGYQPQSMSKEQANGVALEFINRKLVKEFGNVAQHNKPFDWTLTQQQANEALASMDDIAFLLGGKQGDVERHLAKQGLSQPAVQFLDGRVVLMVRAKKYDKVLSLELSFTSLPDGRLGVQMEDVRIGRLRVPRSLVETELTSMRTSMAASAPATTQGGASIGPVHARELGKVLKDVLGAIDGKPIDPVLQYKTPLTGRKIKVKVQSVELGDGYMTLHMEPVAADKSAASEPVELPDIPFLPN
jgi:hypothetical protein